MKKTYAAPVSHISRFFISTFFFLGVYFSVSAQGDGRDGSIVVNSGVTINTDSIRAAITSNVASGQTKLILSTTTDFQPNDEVLIIQMEGGKEGRFETGIISKKIAGNTIQLKTNLKNNYFAGTASSKAQVIRIMQYNNLTINNGGKLSCHVYTSSLGTGGVCYFYAKGTVTVNAGGAIDVSGKGFSGGQGGAGGSTQGATGKQAMPASCDCNASSGGACQDGDGYTAACGGYGSNYGGRGGCGGPATFGPGGKGLPGEGSAGGTWGSSFAQNKSSNKSWKNIFSGDSLFLGSGGGGNDGKDAYGGGFGAAGGQGELMGTPGTNGTDGSGAPGADGGNGGGILVIFANTLQNFGNILANGSVGGSGHDGGNGGSGGNGGNGGAGSTGCGDAVMRAGGGGNGGDGGDATGPTSGGDGGAGGSIWMLLTSNTNTLGTQSANGGAGGNKAIGPGSAGGPGFKGLGGVGGSTPGAPGFDGNPGNQIPINTIDGNAGGAGKTKVVGTEFIITSSISGTFCNGSKIVVSYSCSSGFNSNNIFSVELSDSTGSFNSPTIIGSTGSKASGSISCFLPLSIPSGKKYLLRVVSSNPSIESNNNGSDLTIQPSTTTINGIARHNNGSSKITAGIAELYSYANGSHMLRISSSTITSGVFSFTNVPADEYLILAKPDTALYNNTISTYYGDSLQWELANKVSVACSGNDSVKINLYDLPANPGGKGKISGQVTKGAKYVKLHTVDPLQGVIISIGKKPKSHSNIVAQTTTDVNGDYAFTNLPIGDYQVFVDIPGLPMDSTYSPSVTSGDSIFNNLDYVADSAKIYINGSPQGINNPAVAISKNSIIAIYPNPFAKRTSIQLDLQKDAGVEVSLYNSVGQKVSVLENNTLMKGHYIYQIGDLTSGLYFLVLNVTGNYSHYRLVSVE